MRDPKMVDAFSNLGTVQSIRGRYGEAEQSFRKGLDHAPNHVGMQVKLGWILIRKGDWDESRQCFEAALRVNPRMLRAISGLATVYEREGRLQDALDVMSPFVQEGTLLPIFAQTYALVCRRMNKPDRALGIVEACLQRERSTEEEAGLLHAYGDLLDRLKRSSEAFQAHTLANKARNHPHDSEAHARYVAAIVRAFGRRQLSEMPRSSSQASPIFVVGMPRSGTSLVEQILASHAQVFGASDLDTWSEEYLRSLPKEAADSVHFVDKMPFNFLHIGLISRLFPKARIVHCRRDPQDTCLSVFFQQFSPYYAFSTDLVGLAKYYRDYRSLMAHWDRVFPGKIVSVQYEELVASPEELIPKMLDDCGLSMEESCLRFWENPRQVDTASYAQVRRPLYSSSIGRSEAYADQLAPLRTILDLR
jgi:tetratricopeptide (TPR) repeat protein